MASDRIVAIYANHQTLKDVVEALDQHDIGDVSVLIRQQPDESTRDDIPVDGSALRTDEVITDASAPYSVTQVRSTEVTGKLDYRQPELHDATAYATQTGSREVDDRLLMSGAATPAHGPDTLVPDLENAASQTNLANPERGALDTSVVEDHRIDERLKEHGDVSIKDPNALKNDAIKGGVLGLLAGAAALLIPGVGPVLAAGPIAAALAALAGGAALGTAAGGFIGLLHDEGIPDDRVEAFRQAFDAGKGIVIVKLTDDDAQSDRSKVVQGILNQHFPESIETLRH